MSSSTISRAPSSGELLNVAVFNGGVRASQFCETPLGVNSVLTFALGTARSTLPRPRIFVA
ncbi:hypothetical protein D3C87_1753830 [compost metagenome]